MEHIRRLNGNLSGSDHECAGGKRRIPPRCEDCEFFDYDDDAEAYICHVSLDEDEMASFLSGRTGRCPYYRYYDEYKSVHKQI